MRGSRVDLAPLQSRHAMAEYDSRRNQTRVLCLATQSPHRQLNVNVVIVHPGQWLAPIVGGGFPALLLSWLLSACGWQWIDTAADIDTHDGAIAEADSATRAADAMASEPDAGDVAPAPYSIVTTGTTMVLSQQNYDGRAMDALGNLVPSSSYLDETIPWTLTVDVVPGAVATTNANGLHEFELATPGGLTLSDGTRTISFPDFKVRVDDDYFGGGMYFAIVGLSGSSWVSMTLSAPEVVPELASVSTIADALQIALMNAVSLELKNQPGSGIWLSVGVNTIDVIPAP